MDDTRRYTIGELARRTGLSDKTIRFYSDTGVVSPIDRTYAGHRLYDVEAVTRSGLVRTLRELGAGLDEVRRVLSEETTVSTLATTHLELLEEQMRLLRTRRAVLRAVVKHEGTAEGMRLMHKLANASDEERNRLIDEFWNEITDGLSIEPAFEQWVRSAKPTLPDDPSTEQVEAWIELAELVRTQEFRDVVRAVYREMPTARAEGGSRTQPVDEAKRMWALTEEVRAAYDAGVAPASVRGEALADRIATGFLGSGQTGAEARREAADRFEQHYDERVERYWELLYTINGWELPPMLGPVSKWLAAALRASA